MNELDPDGLVWSKALPMEGRLSPRLDREAEKGEQGYSQRQRSGSGWFRACLAVVPARFVLRPAFLRHNLRGRGLSLHRPRALSHYCFLPSVLPPKGLSRRASTRCLYFYHSPFDEKCQNIDDVKHD